MKTPSNLYLKTTSQYTTNPQKFKKHCQITAIFPANCSQEKVSFLSQKVGWEHFAYKCC